jgi:hypothetical protein
MYDILPTCIDNKILQYSITGASINDKGKNIYTLQPIGGYVYDYPRLYSSGVTLYQSDGKKVENKTDFYLANLATIYDRDDYYLNRQV